MRIWSRLIGDEVRWLDHMKAFQDPQMGELGSDAPFNLGFAVAASMSLPEGVWVAMQITAWDPDEVEKDLELHRFKKRFMEDSYRTQATRQGVAGKEE